MAQPDRTVPATLATRADAEALIRRAVDTIAALETALETETRHLAAGRIGQGLAGDRAKADLTGAYLAAITAAKTNAVAAKRLAPDLLPHLGAAQAQLHATALRNQAVLATAKAVSEGLVRAMADEVAKQARPQSYGLPARHAAPARAPGPVAFSGRF